MLIGICGGICAGKHSVAEYLVQQHQFLRLHLPSQPTTLPSNTTSNDDVDDGQDADRLLPTVTDERGTRGLTFPDVNALLDFVTKRWREHWVLTDIWDEGTLQSLLIRPFFMLVSVDGSVGVRWRRFNESLEKFIQWSDNHLYSNNNTTTTATPTTRTHHNNPNPRTGTAYLSSRAHLSILNNFATIPAFHAALSTLDIVSSTRLRPTWDAYFMTLASLAAQRSNCMKRRVGCVLVRSNRVISTGYNGTPRHLRNCNEGGCARCNGGVGAAPLSTCLCLHAEENALLEAGRERIGEGSILYCDTCPCLTCSVKITQVGIGEVVFSQTYNMDSESRAIFEAGGVKLRQFSPPAKGLVDLGMEVEDEDGARFVEDGDLNRKALVKHNGVA